MKKIIFLLVFLIITNSVYASSTNEFETYDYEFIVDTDYLDTLENNDEVEPYFLPAVIPLGAFAKVLLDTALAAGALYSVGQTFVTLKNQHDLLKDLDYSVEVKNNKFTSVNSVEALKTFGVDNYTAVKLESLYKKYVDKLKKGETLILSSSDVKGVDFKALTSSFGYSAKVKAPAVSLNGLLYINDKSAYDFSAIRDDLVKCINNYSYYVIYTNYVYYCVLFTNSTDYVGKGTLKFSDAVGFSFYTGSWRNNGVLDVPIDSIYATNIKGLPVLSNVDSLITYHFPIAPTGIIDNWQDGIVSDVPVAFPKDGITIPIDSEIIGALVSAPTLGDTIDVLAGGLVTGDVVSDGALTDVSEVIQDDTVQDGIQDYTGSFDSIIGSIDGFFGWFTNPLTIDLDLSPLYISVKDRFPFSLPYDLYNLFDSFVATRETPHFDVKFDEGLVGSASFEIDFSKFDKLAAILRYFILMYFIYGLIKLSRNLIGG